MTFNRRDFLRVSAAAAAGTLAAPSLSLASSNSPITLVSIYQPGGAVDSLLRAIFDYVGREINRTFLMEARVGANGMVAAQYVARAKPNGETLMISTTAALPMNVLLRPKAPFKIEDFDSVAKLFEGALTVTVNSKFPVNSVSELTEWSKTNNKALRCGTLGPGSVTHLYSIMLGKRLGVETRPVAYRNNNAITMDLLAEQIELHFATPIALTEYAKAGQLKMLAITTKERHPDFPDVPSITEAGYSDLLSSFWNGLSAPKGTSQDFIGELNAAVQKVLKSDEIAALTRSQGMLTTPGEPSGLDAQIADDIARWGEIVRAEGIVLE